MTRLVAGAAAPVTHPAERERAARNGVTVRPDLVGVPVIAVGR